GTQLLGPEVSRRLSLRVQPGSSVKYPVWRRMVIPRSATDLAAWQFGKCQFAATTPRHDGGATAQAVSASG
ncbi:MAG: hypothetical protein KDM81_13110, partial [Verrucomicrobiae bacterium]|nr:hypothetical protein [Verrucomicrobiae bacterium]